MAEGKNKSKEEKNEAVVNGKDLHLSVKYAVAICDAIRRKDIDFAIARLEEAANLKKAIPMKGEIAHKKGMMSGKYPVKGARIFIKLLKSLKANAISQDLELEKFRIWCKADKAPEPYKRFGQGRMKRCHAKIKLIKISEKSSGKEK